MTNDLPGRAPKGNGRRVKNWLARLILICALLMGTLHAPAMAHADPVGHHAHDEVTAQVAVDVDHDGTPSSHDGASDTFHHHHCPAAVGVAASDMTPGISAGKAMHPLASTVTLLSRSQAPPTEPPAA